MISEQVQTDLPVLTAIPPVKPYRVAPLPSQSQRACGDPHKPPIDAKCPRP